MGWVDHSQEQVGGDEVGPAAGQSNTPHRYRHPEGAESGQEGGGGGTLSL